MDKDIRRRKKIQENYSTCFVLSRDISNYLREAIDAAVPIGIFKQNPRRAIDWFSSQSSIVREEIVLRGLDVSIRNAKILKKSGRKGIIWKRNYSKGIAAVKLQKAKQFDRVVEMLDLERVGDKLLGDCTKGDLLRAAVAAEQEAGRMTMQAGFYRLLADLMEHGQTVRQSNRRGEIVALLNQNFRED